MRHRLMKTPSSNNSHSTLRAQERKRANTRIRLQRSLISTALSARLTRCGQIAQRNLADLFRKDDKTAFANLFDAVRDVRNSCDAARRYAILEPEMESLQSPGPPSSENLETPLSTTGSIASGSSVAPFFNDISASAREAFLNFLTQLRTNPDYLATRLCSLNASELQALTVFHEGLEPVDTVLPFHPGPGRPSGRSHAGNAGKSSGPPNNAVERFLSFQRHDPLSALIHTSFANSAGPDSAEDKRRTEIWATAFARLISTRRHSEPTLVKILNVWSTMRDWSGQGNMEWYLMRILEDGAFLLDRAEDQRGTRFNVSDWTTKDAIAAEEFYDRAVEELFEVVDDEDATGIPEGVIELGNEVLRRLDKTLADDTRRWFVYKWIFSTWLPAVVIHPESHGLMAEYHITEYARQKILKEVATRAQKLVIDRINNMGNPQIPVSIPPKIKSHIENIVGRFMPSRTKKTPRLLPARSITSLRETAEVRPYLVISPADLLTLVNALFPERRPRSARSSSIRSGAPSVSGFSAMSQPISIENSRSNFDTASLLSVSASSALSDATTSREPLLEEMPTGTPQRYSPPVPDSASQRRLNKYEDDGYRLRLAMHEMVQVLGTEVVAGSCHPCAERWTVLFISADGNSLSLQMTYDPDEDPDEENSSTTSDTEDDEQDSGPELDKDYHLLRDSILKLVEDFEIPRGLDDRGNKTTLSNRASGLKRYRSKNKVVTPARTMASRNPYRRREEERQQQQDDAQSIAGTDASRDEPESQPVLVAMLTAASSQSRVQSDFVSAHLYWKTLQRLNAIASPSLRKNGFEALLNIFSRGPRDSIHRSAAAIEEYDAVLVWLKQSQERHEGLVESMVKRLRALRDKMWYVTDVHNSSPYTDLRSFCSALKIMGAPKKWEVFKRQRAQLSRGPVANYIYRSESQTLDILAATEEQGGPNKLRDEQAEKTTNWLEQFGIDNFCQGEERIHRFCCEVDLCVGKLVGDTMADAPVLWAGPLYGRDKKALDLRSGNRDRDNSVGVDDAVSVSVEKFKNNEYDDRAATSDTISPRSRPSSKSGTPDFPYKKAYQRLLRMFSVHPNPSTKLNALYELQQLIIASLSSGGRRSRWMLRHQLNANEDNISGLGGKRLHEQTIESVRERRSQTIRASAMPENQSPDAETRSIASPSLASPDTVVNILRSLFKDASVRPKSLFRDLQYIASFVPATMLDDTDQGKAFWNAGLAALSLKQDVCKTMVEVADEVVKAHSEKRRASNNSSDDPAAATPPAVINHSLEDAGRMLTITAKERDPTAQRELALFILGYPELVEKPLLPLSKPREVFKQAVMEKFGARTNNSGRHSTDRGRTGLAVTAPTQSGQPEAGRENDVRSDPALMCVTIHWMKAAEQGGDELATRFIRQNEMGLA
ncbi:hypothetical protein UCREL1_3915 [Eutypa lata UCREL1]|uniref:Uncharacterized protein n=1 Tax=Eutypa lata (strain UCR-EL1) TaxID=1287681 RepID=M7TGK3_EUTLA|nr:hypothetical protein UCREL1_3915 [Eutypa lata UCREL1]